MKNLTRNSQLVTACHHTGTVVTKTRNDQKWPKMTFEFFIQWSFIISQILYFISTLTPYFCLYLFILYFSQPLHGFLFYLLRDNAHITTSNNHRLESAGLNALEELLRCWECTEKLKCVVWNWMFLDILPEVIIAVLQVVEMSLSCGWMSDEILIEHNNTELLKSTNMKIRFTSFDSTRGLRQPGDQTGSRCQKIILRFTLWDKWDICGRRQNMSNGSFKKWKWFPVDLTTHNNNRYSIIL